MTDTTRIGRWVREGPGQSDGTIGFIVGNFLHWRLWATLTLAISPILIGGIVLAHFGPSYAVLAASVVGVLAGEKSVKISPKYDVTKNY